MWWTALSAIKYAKVKTVRDETGLVIGYEAEGDFPKYGNDDDRADEIAVWLLKSFLEKVKRRHTYRNSEATTSIWTITSNVVYGKATGATPDGRKAYTPFAPGANPSYGAETHGLLASLNSVAKLPLPLGAGRHLEHPDDQPRRARPQLPASGWTTSSRSWTATLTRARTTSTSTSLAPRSSSTRWEHPEKEEYANFTIRVSGYAVKFIDLTREQQLDVIARTCHKKM